jgi:catechol 2,3-dioxygenase-like lactoylglutathione lyase family enzyme
VAPQHYAFLVSEAEFDGIYARLRERNQEHWADPHTQQPGQINHDDSGRGVYFRDPDGHFVEVLTVRYGGRPSPSVR